MRAEPERAACWPAALEREVEFEAACRISAIRLAKTARVITAAAAIMVVVFLSLVLGADVRVKEIGLGLAVAVLIDATIVRMVPAVMELLGKANWWLPAPLARILPKASRSEAANARRCEGESLARSAPEGDRPAAGGKGLPRRFPGKSARLWQSLLCWSRRAIGACQHGGS